MRERSKMQQKIYEYIAACIREQGYPPSVREIGEAVGLKSPSTVHFHLKRLEASLKRAPARAAPSRCGNLLSLKIRSQWWAMWRPAAPFWRRSVSRTI